MHHYRHFFYRLIHDLRQLGGGIIAWTLLLFIFAIFAYWPVTAILGAHAGSSLVTVAIGALIVGKIKKRRPGFTVNTPTMSVVYKFTAVAFTVAAVGGIVYTYLTKPG